MVFKLIFDQFIDLHLLYHLLAEFLLVHIHSWVSKAQGIARYFQVWKDPFISGIIEDDLIIDHLDVFSRNEIINDEILQLEFFLENSSSFLKLFDLGCILLLQLVVFILQIFQSFHFLLDLEALIFIFFLQTFVNFVHIVNGVFFFLQILLNLTLFLSFLFEFMQFSLELVSFFNSCLLLFFTSEHLLLHLLELFNQILLILFVKCLLLLSFLYDFQKIILLLLQHVLLLVDLSFFLFKLSLYFLGFHSQLFFHIFRIFLLNNILNNLAIFTSHILGHLLSQFLDLFLELPQKCILGVFIDPYIILNVLGAICILQSRKSFIIVITGRTDISNHNSLCITSQRILKQSCKLRVTIRDMF